MGNCFTWLLVEVGGAGVWFDVHGGPFVLGSRFDESSGTVWCLKFLGGTRSCGLAVLGGLGGAVCGVFGLRRVARLTVDEALVLRFLRRLRDGGALVGQRLQAARALEGYWPLAVRRVGGLFRDVQIATTASC